MNNASPTVNSPFPENVHVTCLITMVNFVDQTKRRSIFFGPIIEPSTVTYAQVIKGDVY